MTIFPEYIAKYAPQYNNDKKLIRYRDILKKIVHKYYENKLPIKLFKHQHLRIEKMMHKEYPNIIVRR